MEKIDVKGIIEEMEDFYGLKVSEEEVLDWLEFYHFDRIEEDPGYDGNFLFETSEREDFYIYLVEE
jgi:hypothetical protein